MRRTVVGVLACALLLAVVMFAPGRHASAQTAHNVTLSWNYTQGSDAATGFVVQRATSAAGPFTTLTTTPLATTQLTFVDTTGTGGTAYWYQVYAVDAQGNKSAVDELAMSISFLVNPAAPTGLTAVAN